MTAKGLGCLSKVLSSNQLFSTSLTHLDLSGNSGSLVTEDATFLFKFLSSTNSLSHLDLSDTSCPLDTLFVSLSAGCCYKLVHLNLARNPFTHRKVREVTRSIQEFFGQSCQLRYVGLSATRLPPQALRLLLQGLATNTRLFGLELDLSSCELRSAGAQVVQEHICEASSISSLDISDNGLENDMVTLVLSVGRCPSLRHLSLGRNFTLKSRALTDLLHRIAQLIQDEECPLQSLSVCDSKLKTGMHILLSALGGHATLVELDISGNNIGDTGAKMLAKALITNTRLRTLSWDRNNVTARGFQDVADALERWFSLLCRNFTLQNVSLPLADIMQSYRSNPERTKETLHKIQACLDRNNQRQSSSKQLQQVFKNQQSEKVLQGMCRQLEESLDRLSHCSTEEVQNDVLMTQEVLQNARDCMKLLPSLCEEGMKSSSDEDQINDILSDAAAALTEELTRNMQELVQGLMRHAEATCPRVVQRSSICKCLSDSVNKRSRQAHVFLRNTVVETTGKVISAKLCDLRQTLTDTLAESVVEQVLQDLTAAQDKMDCLVKENSCNRINIPELRLGDGDFPTDDYSPAIWRNSVHCKSLRPAASLKSLLDADWEHQSRDRRSEKQGGGSAGEEDGGGSFILPRLLPATPPSPSPSTSTSLSPPPPAGGGKRCREGEVSADAAVSGGRGAVLVSPPSLPPPAPEEEAAGYGRLHRRQAPFPGCGPLHDPGAPSAPMEPLPTGGHSLRHYTASRPRPRRTHTQPPAPRPQESESKEEKETDEVMGRVDEGVEEFFTKKIIPDYALKGQWEESNPAQATPSELSPTHPASTSFSSSSDFITSSIPVTSPVPTDTSITSPDTTLPATCPSHPTSTAITTTTTSTLPTKNIKKKFGDFFAFKRARTGRVAKAGGGEGGGAEGVKVKRTSIADLIRPLREAKEREREREREKDREKERGERSVEDANVCNDATTTEGTAAASRHLAGEATETTPPVVITTTPPSETASSYPTITMSPDLSRGLAESPVLLGLSQSPTGTSSRTELDTQSGGTPSGEKRLRVTKRLREVKSQSLILLTGLEPEDKDNTPSKKHASESSSFEQRLQVMLHRMGVTKSPPADTKARQNKDEELRKANSEGAILDRHDPPPAHTKPRTMSSSSAEPRHPTRAQGPIPPDPVLLPKPPIPGRPAGFLPPKPAVAAKPALSTAAGATPRPSSAPPSSTSTQHQDGSLEGEQGAAPALPPRREVLPSPPWTAVGAQLRSEKAQSVTEESLPKPRQHLKPPPQRRAVSVHEDTLAMTQELKAVLQKSPIRFQGNRRNLPSCREDEAQQTQDSCTGQQTDEDTKDKERIKDYGRAGLRSQHPLPGEERPPPSRCASTLQEVMLPSTLEKPPEPTQALQKSPVTPTSQKKSPSTISAPRTPERLQVSSPTTAPASPRSPEAPQVGPLPHLKDRSGRTERRGEAASHRNTTTPEPAHSKTSKHHD
ncbi:capping protein, Arp2/3 and myosin-I linker protein 2 isoform X1 [Cololabis saira]|uniref:capping protein, Arp2/3 and myosin-I linker protein 2 isoform X1 n=1 Tax=Cololabis saira TaxID=129043 RepID=UPI002AD4B8F4|nr:capping protein, Arp2/3 and myosin-I linker protein 2 isoform X1 [Cololabis saira]